MYEDMPAAEEVEPPVSPLEAWLADAQFTDCFGEVVSREKLERAEVIGVRSGRREGREGKEVGWE